MGDGLGGLAPGRAVGRRLCLGRKCLARQAKVARTLLWRHLPPLALRPLVGLMLHRVSPESVPGTAFSHEPGSSSHKAQQHPAKQAHALICGPGSTKVGVGSSDLGCARPNLGCVRPSLGCVRPGWGCVQAKPVDVDQVCADVDQTRVGFLHCSVGSGQVGADFDHCLPLFDWFRPTWGRH